MNKGGSELSHRFVGVNGIRMHIAEAGRGPLVLLVHGFPELWYDWRYLLPALAEAGYHAVAPDMRGYGQTDAPVSVAAYSQHDLIGDLVDLVHVLGEQQAIIVGHDWGSLVTGNAAAVRPDIFRAVVLLSSPYVQRSPKGPPTRLLEQRGGEQGQFYQWYFQEPGVAEMAMDADPERSLRMMFYTLGGNVPPEQRWRYVFRKDETILDSMTDPKHLPAWLKADDLTYYASEFKRTGFRGGLNWYRNLDLWWQTTPWLNGRKLHQPVLFIYGADDPVAEFTKPAIDAMPTTVTDIRVKVLPGIGHWIAGEAPEALAAEILAFLRELEPRGHTARH